MSARQVSQYAAPNCGREAGASSLLSDRRECGKADFAAFLRRSPPRSNRGAILTHCSAADYRRRASSVRTTWLAATRRGARLVEPPERARLHVAAQCAE